MGKQWIRPWCKLAVRPRVTSMTCSRSRQVWARHRPKNKLQHSRGVDHFSAASITFDEWEGSRGPTAAESAWINTTGVFLQGLRSSSPSLFLLQSARVKQTILSSPSSHYGSERSLLGNMAYLISAYRSRWAANACSKSQFFLFLFFSKPRAPLQESSVEITNENLAGVEAPIYHPSYECYTSF